MNSDDPRLRRSPDLSFSDLIVLRNSESSGYGLFATQEISAGTILSTSRRPDVYVVYRVFRREVCAWCFQYERGRNWNVRLSQDNDITANAIGGGSSSTGMVFCSEMCRDSWRAEYGTDGLEAYAAVEEHLRRQMRSKGWTSDDNQVDDSREPTEQEIEDVRALETCLRPLTSYRHGRASMNAQNASVLIDCK